MKSIMETYTPEVWKSYLQFTREVCKDGALSSKFKEFLMIALSITAGCEPCVRIHLKRAILRGATPEEIAELVGVVTMMVGGPSEVCFRDVINEELNKLEKVSNDNSKKDK